MEPVTEIFLFLKGKKLWSSKGGKKYYEKWLHKGVSWGVTIIIQWLQSRRAPFAKRKNHFLCTAVPSSGLWDSTAPINVPLAASGLRCNTRAIPQTSIYASVIPPGPPLFSGGTYHRKQFCWWCAKWDRGVSSLSFSGGGSAGLTGAKSSEKWIFTTEVSSCDPEHIKATAFLS